MFTAEQLAQLATLIAAGQPKPRAKKAKGKGRVKLTDEQKVINAKANAEVAEKLFADAGYVDNRAHETIRTYDKWIEAGRRVQKGQKAIRTPKGVALFHLTQTEPLAKAN